MLDKHKVVETVSLFLLKEGYSILREPRVNRRAADIVARDGHSDHRIHIIAKGGMSRYGKPYTDSQVFDRVAKGIYSIARMHEARLYDQGDKVALALPDTPVFRKYVSPLEPVMNRFGIIVFFVTEDGAVEKL